MLGIFKKIILFILKNTIWRKYVFGKNFHAGRGVVLWAKNSITIGKNFYIGRYSQIECDAVIGDNVIIGNYVAFVGKYDHKYQQIGTPTRLASAIRDKDYDWLGLQSKIIIEDDVWIGYGAVIMSGVKIFRGSIIAAGSIVTKDVPVNSIVGGNPAKFLRHRFNNAEWHEHTKHNSL
ncbi:acyltransferase [Leeuwenhoekiella marinoflava]|uniref:acyltransferase n=1 Tax=Leeuwenhoekiella marinoflava TaxID=988 RepID=UPI00300371B5